MADDGVAAAEIARQIAALKPRVEGSRGVMGYLVRAADTDKPPSDKRADVNKMFLASTIRGVNSHNRRQEEDKCWTLRSMGRRKLDEPRDRRRPSRRSRSCSSERRRPSDRKRRRSPSISRSRSRNRSRRSRSRDRSPAAEAQNEKEEGGDERSFWARKKAEKTRKLWEKLHSGGTVSVENAPDFSSEESDHDDVKPTNAKAAPPPDRDEKKHKKHHKKHKKHGRKSDKKATRRRSRL
ncbi:hypothetical protein PHYPSEUDO_004942 [Phytophthora pseudosyringae]|uniref:Uncharacterized protein n=1 Tax=Phytophthora pseudosyringae TaxID=221518 RepID=A0A8T1WCJ9_9STRA|nr:hypothetical protein PHYPSEUDO_004942 [Phytophthora pseudosyringae]